MRSKFIKDFTKNNISKYMNYRIAAISHIVKSHRL
ncbi:hypothetical protein Metev_0167 [Methanohalobium evestigatum Z-7303]|uniref:Uncharacterized protein n=1 Tax=Methanohalobium evestigatum (strain ATCC BAA-1072 / DSM 3721 / NBRC 107634 / OCM 161 / Z-7303) TaxID=644295 RepID=D7E676_METEZ|nr:hypothetical protein Metev_0167 [Methanohalobium evestigatum Z-7303]